MDLSTLIGFVTCIVFIVFGIISGGGNILTYLDIASILIVLGGAVGSSIAGTSLASVMNIGKIARTVFNNQAGDSAKLILTMLSLSEKARREGLLALEDDVEEMTDEFLKMGIQLVVDGTEPEMVRNIMDVEITAISNRHANNRNLFEDMAAMAPAFGMIGTLIGLVVMMTNLGGDTSAIGRGMAAALITTLYGAIIANAFFIPISKKLERNTDNELSLKEIIVEGTLSIQAGDNPSLLQQKLIAYFPPSTRANIKEQLGD